MLMDKELILSDSQNLAQTVGTYVSTNTIDMGVAGTIPSAWQSRGTPPHDIGRTEDAELLVQVNTTFTSGGAATVQAQVITSANADLSSPTVIESSAAIAYATLIAGYQFRVGLVPGLTQRYLGVQYVIAGATTTAGTVTAGIVLDKQTTTI